MADLLLRNDATHEADNDGETPLLLAAYHGDVEMVELLVENGAAHDADNQGKTPIHWACERGRLMMTLTLIDLGADPEAKDHVCCFEFQFLTQYRMESVQWTTFQMKSR